MDRIDAWQIFLQVAEFRSFSEAARRSGISAGQVSKQIAALEDRLGVRLFERTTRAVRLTPEGEDRLDGARSLMDAAIELEREGSAASGVTGTVRITAPVIFGSRVLAPAVSRFLKQHDGLNIRLHLTDRRVDLVNDGFELALRIGEPADVSLVGRRLRSVELRLLAAPERVAELGHPKTPEDLQDWPCLIDLNVARPRQWQFERDGEDMTVRVDGRFESDSADVVLEACRQGLGAALVPDFCLGPDCDAGDLVPLLPDWSTPRREVWLLWPPGRHVAPRTRAVVDYLVEALKI